MSINTVAIDFITINILRTTDLTRFAHIKISMHYAFQHYFTGMDVNSSVVSFMLVQVIYNDLHSSVTCKANRASDSEQIRIIPHST